MVILKLTAAVVLGGTIILSLRARAPRHSVPAVDLRRLVFGAIALYAVGAAAWITHHRLLAAGVYAAGILTAARAAWLSRGRDAEDPLSGFEGFDEDPPLGFGPDEFDWESFERDFLAYAEGRREPAGLD
jgi:hypothetical protein